MYEKPIVIGSRAWLGTRVIVLPGAVLGNDVIVGSGSVVTKSLPPEGIYAGSPARLIRQRISLDSPVAER
ncbi:DapH/DapD/GlmU-related protein [Arthrobacter sp. ZGTC131]|uniref:acyltransferase n=1 Tax=Arthrobacter sp. ZGTC131 TaxID=2058898 RepID=UPI0034D6F69A